MQEVKISPAEVNGHVRDHWGIQQDQLNFRGVASPFMIGTSEFVSSLKEWKW
jgi:hypothetical protein